MVKAQKTISFILPVFNEEVAIEKFNSVLQKTLSDCGVLKKYQIEYVFINDGSRDSTEDLVRKFIKTLDGKNEKAKLVNFSHNFGHEIALAAGIDKVSGDCAIIMDTDLQDPPRVIPELIAKWEEGKDIVYAQRKNRKDGFLKKLTANAFYRLFEKLTGGSIPRNVGNFRLIDKKAILVLRNYRERARFFRGIVSSIGFQQAAVLFERDERVAGKSHYPWASMIGLAVDGILGFSNKPLKFITKMGFIFSLFSILFAFYILVSKFIQLPIIGPNSTIPGWTTTAIMIMFFSGVQISVLGVIATYIGRIFVEAQNRPLYIVDEERSIL